MVVDPDRAIVAGLKVAVAPAGNPDAENVTVPLNPFTVATVAV